jgi:hypothetical protein
MKKLTTLLLLLVMAVGTASAQFEQGKSYVGASVSGLGLSYSAKDHFSFGLQATAGHFVADCLLLHANIGYDHKRHIDDLQIGAGVRYYLDECGIFLGAGAEFDHYTKSSNDVMIPLTVGYAFFLNRYLTLEPSVYYKMSMHDFSDNSTLGVNIGLGFYF